MSDEDKDLLQIRRNPWVLGAAAAPLLLLLFGSLPTSLRLAPASLALSAALFYVLWRWNPWPRKVAARVFASRVGLTIDGLHTPAAMIRDAFVLPQHAMGPQILIGRRWPRPALQLEVPATRSDTPALDRARALLRALGHDASQRVAHMRGLSRLFNRWWLPTVAWLGAALVGGVASRPFHGSPINVLLFAVPMLAMLAVTILPTKVAIGADGIEVRWGLQKRFVRYPEVELVSRFDWGFGSSSYQGVDLLLTSGEVVRVTLGQRRYADGKVLMMMERIREARESAASDALDDAGVIGRRGRDVATWLRDLRTLGAGANATMRQAPIDRERFVRLVDDAAAKPLDRAAAAAAMTATLDGETRVRLRAAAEATAAPRLRVAFEAAAGGDDDALCAALSELASEAEGTTPRAAGRNAGASATRKATP